MGLLNNHKANNNNSECSLLYSALNAKYVFISVMGPHANETENDIYTKKLNNIKICGKSFWVSRIFKKYIEESRRKLNRETGYLILVESKSATDTKEAQTATKYSENQKIWEDIDYQLNDVTGYFYKNGATAYYFDKIELCNKPIKIDLNDYVEAKDYLKAIKFWLGHTNVFAKKSNIKMHKGMKSHERKIVAVLRLKYPYVVWVK